MMGILLLNLLFQLICHLNYFALYSILFMCSLKRQEICPAKGNESQVQEVPTQDFEAQEAHSTESDPVPTQESQTTHTKVEAQQEERL